MKKKSNELVNIIRKIGLIIAENNEQKKMLQMIAATLGTSLKSDICTIHVYDEKENTLVMAATYGYPKEYIGRRSLAPGEGITGKVFQTGKLINTANEKVILENNNAIDLQNIKYNSVLAVPLIIAEEVVGVLSLKSSSGDIFPKHVTELVKEVTLQIANVLIDYRLFHQLLIPSAAAEVKHNTLLSGQAVSTGIVTGTAFLMDSDCLLESISWKKCENIDAELKLFDEAVEHAKEETMRLEKEASKVLTESNVAIFYSHFLILEDKQLLDTVRALIQDGYITRFALKTTLDQLRKKFDKIDSESIRERIADITDVILRIIHSVSHILQGRKCRNKKMFNNIDDGERLIIIAHELYPSQLISWPLYKMAGIICETGGATSHVAIIAKALKIPTLMGVKNASKEIKERDNLLLDCHASNCYVNPTEDLLATFATSLKMHKNAVQESVDEADTHQQTTDGTAINLYANLSLVSEIPLLKQYGANGIGLYRSEFVFMVRTAQPTIKEQHRVFQKFAEECHDKTFTLRLLDIGGDKPVSYLNFESETNPLLGVRGLRFLLRNPRLFKAHIEAILHTTLETNIKILIPMVTTVDELVLCKSIINQVRERMEKRYNRKFNNYQIGAMIETPSIIWELDKLMPLVDFISIGTNDLIQYSYAVDRNNSTAIGNFYGANPATIRFLKHIVDVTSKFPNKPLTICGEMGSDIHTVPLLIGIGFRSFSMSPWLIPTVRNLVKTVAISDCQNLVSQYIKLERQDEATMLISEFLQKHDIKAIES